MTMYKHAKIAESQREDPRNEIPEGTRTVVFGKDADPDYTVLTDDGPVRITFETIKEIEAPERMTKARWRTYLQREILPLDEDDADDEQVKA